MDNKINSRQMNEKEVRLSQLDSLSDSFPLQFKTGISLASLTIRCPDCSEEFDAGVLNGEATNKKLYYQVQGVGPCPSCSIGIWIDTKIYPDGTAEFADPSSPDRWTEANTVCNSQNIIFNKILPPILGGGSAILLYYYLF